MTPVPPAMTPVPPAMAALPQAEAEVPLALDVAPMQIMQVVPPVAPQPVVPQLSVPVLPDLPMAAAMPKQLALPPESEQEKVPCYSWWCSESRIMASEKIFKHVSFRDLVKHHLNPWLLNIILQYWMFKWAVSVSLCTVVWTICHPALNHNY